MNKSFILFMALLAGQVNAQDKFWQSSSEKNMKSSKTELRKNNPAASDQKFFKLNLDGLKTALQNKAKTNKSTNAYTTIDFPDAEGNLQAYKVWETQTMAPELAAQYPDYKSYVGESINKPNEQITFTINYFGLSALALNGTDSYAIQSISHDNQNYAHYKVKNLAKSKTPFVCGVDAIAPPSTQKNNPNNFVEAKKRHLNQKIASDSILRTFRLAFGCTEEFSDFHVNRAKLPADATVAAKKAVVAAAIQTTINEVNVVYKREMAMQFQLIANNNNIIMLDNDVQITPTKQIKLNNDKADTLLVQSQKVIHNLIGPANYDIGHFGSTGAGGLASPYPCVANSKAEGVTGLETPMGYNYNIEYVAHEFAHQFGANHTFNDSCTKNRNRGTAVEPGSASTIMGYAGNGFCPNNIQARTDDYFHIFSLEEMIGQINKESNCAIQTKIANSRPTANAGADHTIPKSTAYVLTGTAIDAEDQDRLTYTWEQSDIQISPQPPLASSTKGPNYRSLRPSTSPKRYMPEFSQVLRGNLTPTWEVTPSVGRNLTFRFTVRDNSPLGGFSHNHHTTITVSNTAGPFKVTSQAIEGIEYPLNSSQEITWDVAGTDDNDIDTENVRISLSTDGGTTFSHVLAESTPNDGKHNITLPDETSTNCRIKIEAIDNIYYAVNDKRFTILDPANAASGSASGSANLGPKEFSISPNPSKGDFKINNYKALDPNIAIVVTIFDGSGRVMHTSTYANAAQFNPEFNLNLQKGLYVININEGERNINQKIIID
jgi:Metallo-peptidase family M12/Secretion system C-terminal sorting domain